MTNFLSGSIRRPLGRAALTLALLGGAALLLSSGDTMAQTAPAAHASNTHVPDFSGVWLRSDMDALFLPPASGTRGLQDDPQHPHSGHANGQAAPFVAKLPSPLLKPWVAKIVQHNHDAQLAGVEMLPAHSLCWPSGVPGALRLRENVEMLQSPDEITIIYQRDHQVRRIYLNREHSKTPQHTWYGESVGHYEGDTLVVDTVGMNDKSTTDWYLTPHTDAIHTVERYRVLPDRKTLQVDFTVEDPNTFTTPWSAMVHYRRTPAAFEEIVCAENNLNILTGKDFPIPIAAKADF